MKFYAKKIKLALFCLTLCGLILFTSTATADTIIRVDGANGSAQPSNFGHAWGSDAYKYLQDALARAADVIDNEIDTAVQVWVAAGTYKPDQSAADPGGSGSRSATFALHNQVAIYGGFEGNEPATQQGFLSRDYRANVTILSGEIATTKANNSHHIVTADRVNDTARTPIPPQMRAIMWGGRHLTRNQFPQHRPPMRLPRGVSSRSCGAALTLRVAT